MAERPAQKSKSLVGHTIGKCKLEKVCGRGAMGTVYRGTHLGLDIPVAVKILPPSLAQNGNLVERFLREAKLAAKLSHENTVRVYDVGDQGGFYYLVMEFVDGTDALDLVKNNGPQKSGIVADIGAGAANALDHAHQMDVIHRDIKPANLMLPAEGGVKVADFGLARALSSQSGLTMTGAIMGTPDYMAPEQAQGKPAGPEADVYSLGGSLYHLFVGRPPFAGATPMAVALQHVTNRIRVPEEKCVQDGDRQLAAIIHECTDPDPAKRPNDLKKLADRLLRIARGNLQTDRLVSEGATLFSTAGVQIDAAAIQRAKQEAAAAKEGEEPKADPVLLERLKKAADNARANPSAPSVRPVRSQSSGRLPPVRSPEELESAAGSTTGAASSTSAQPTKDSGFIENPEQDIQAWGDYASTNFPTATKNDIVDGSASGRMDAASSGYEGSVASHVPSIDQSQERYSHAGGGKRKSGVNVGGIIGTVAVIAILGVAGLVIWKFVLSSPSSNNTPENDGPIVAQITLNKKVWQAHRNGTRVNGILELKGGKILTVGTDRTMRLWGADTSKALETQNFNHVPIAVAKRYDNRRFVVVLDTGVVQEFDVSSLNLLDVESMKVEGATAAIWPKLGLIVGDRQGRLHVSTIKEPIPAGRDGTPITGMVVGNDDKLWVTTKTEVASFVFEADNLRRVSVSATKRPITSLLPTTDGLYGIQGQKLVLVGTGGPLALDTEAPPMDQGVGLVLGSNNAGVVFNKQELVVFRSKNGEVAGRTDAGTLFRASTAGSFMNLGGVVGFEDGRVMIVTIR